MKCCRCGGLMTIDYFHGTENSTPDAPPAWKCIQCGEIVDSVILANREWQRIKKSGTTVGQNR
ncbi:hypothetical protein EPN95_04675 [Patescibacteria group bacterium]|nr:MAG: hypothetical protein EPN95_04675 [Patescibacteria group bacterium]